MKLTGKRRIWFLSNELFRGFTNLPPKFSFMRTQQQYGILIGTLCRARSFCSDEIWSVRGPDIIVRFTEMILDKGYLAADVLRAVKRTPYFSKTEIKKAVLKLKRYPPGPECNYSRAAVPRTV